LPAYVNPFHRLIGRRPWRLSTSSRSRPRSRSRSRPDDSGIENLDHGANASPAEPGEEKEPDQESPGGPDRNLPASFTPGDETDENCNEQENDVEDDSNHLLPYQHQDDYYSNSDSTNHPVNLRSLGSLGPRSSMQNPPYRVPSSAMPSFKIPPVEGETNIPKLRAAIRGLAFCLGADLNSRFDPAFHTKVLEGAHGQLFVKLENILRSEKHQPTWASLIELLTHEPRPTGSSFLSRKAALELKPQNKLGLLEPLHVYVDRWISEISQTFGDAALDELDTYLPEALLDRVGTLYGLDLTARVILENQIYEQHKMGSTALNNLLALKDSMTRLAPVSSTTPSLSSQPVQPTTIGTPHAAQHSALRTAGVFRASLRIHEFCHNYANGRCRFTAEDCDRIHAIPDPASFPQLRHANYPTSAPSTFVSSPSAAIAQEVCRDFLRGRCTRRPCRYSHSENRTPMGGTRTSREPHHYHNQQPPTSYFNHRPLEDYPPPPPAKRYRPDLTPSTTTTNAPPSHPNLPRSAANQGDLFIFTPHPQASRTEQQMPSLTPPLPNRTSSRKLFLPDHVRCGLPSCERRLTYDQEFICSGCDVVYYCDSLCQNKHWHQHRESCLSHAASLRAALAAPPVTQTQSLEVQYLTHLAQDHAIPPPYYASQYLNLAPSTQLIEPISVAHVLLRLGQTVQKCLIDTGASWSAISSDVASYLLRTGQDQCAQAIELAPERLSMDTAAESNDPSTAFCRYALAWQLGTMRMAISPCPKTS